MAAKPSFVLSHWYHLFDSLQESPQSFYNCVEGRLKERSIPDAVISRVDYHEGGALTAKREYLRVARMGYVFDICAAPFGNGFFVSWWLAKVLPLWAAWTVVATILGALVVLLLVISSLGLLIGGAITLLALIVVFGVLAERLRVQGFSLGDVLLSLPIIGAICRVLFRETYFKTDTALMFQESIRRVVLDVADQISEAKGLRALSESEREPILNSFFKS